MADPQYGRAGQAGPADGVQNFGAITFLVSQMLNRLETCTLVRVIAVTNDGGLSPVGLVDVQPLVNQLDGNGNAMPHGQLFQLPYFRLQGGTDAVILDPKVGDIGMAAFASRDLSAVKASKQQANPGSWRTHNMADGMYFGGMLNGVPVQYIQFTEGGINVVSPSKVTVQAPAAVVNCETSDVTATESATVTSPAIRLGAMGQTLREFVTSAFMALFNGHTHTTNAIGAPTSEPNQTMGPTHMTTTVKGG